MGYLLDDVRILHARILATQMLQHHGIDQPSQDATSHIPDVHCVLSMHAVSGWAQCIRISSAAESNSTPDFHACTNLPVQICTAMVPDRDPTAEF